jgi:hypothetical protein
MEEIGRKRLATVGVALAGIAYFLVCAVPLQKELLLVPVWSRSIAPAGGSAEVSPQPAGPKPAASKAQPAPPQAAPSGNSADPPLAFRLGDRFGYFTDDGRILFVESASYGVTQAPDAYATYDRLSEGFTIRSPSGTELARVSAPGYPFFAAGRRFIIGPDQATVSELSGNGSIAWTYQFPAVVTAFDASPSLALFGLMDGTMVGFDRSGAVVLDFAPGGSRIAGVYGVAVSPDGLLAAAITGADKQRLVVLEKRSTAYRVTYHRYLASDYRRPVSMAFTEDGRKLAYESTAGIGIYDRAARDEYVIAVPAQPRLGQVARGGELMVFLSSSGGKKRFICTASPDRRVADLSLDAERAFVIAKGDSVFLGLDDKIVRMDLAVR